MNKVKVGKIGSYTCNFISKVFQGGKKMVAGFLLNCTKIPLIVLCRKSRMWVAYKTESIASQEKEKKILYIDSKEVGAVTGKSW